MVLDHPSHVDHIAVDDKWQRAVSIAEGTTAWLWDIKRGRCLGVLEVCQLCIVFVLHSINCVLL